MSWTREDMAKKVISLFTPGCYVNLGIGLPSIVAQYISSQLDIHIHSENGVLGVSGRPHQNEVSPTLINAGKETISIKKGSSFFDSSLSFGMIRGGHIDFSVLGGMEVDTQANLANWMIPGKKITGMGGAMDLVNGAKTVVIMMTHFNKKGQSKLVKKTGLPLTGQNVVDIVVTDHGIFKPNQKSFDIIEIAPGVDKSELSLP